MNFYIKEFIISLIYFINSLINLSKIMNSMTLVVYADLASQKKFIKIRK